MSCRGKCIGTGQGGSPEEDEGDNRSSNTPQRVKMLLTSNCCAFCTVARFYNKGGLTKISVIGWGRL